MSGRVIAVVPAAGSGVRFGTGTNKTLSPLLGKPVLVWTLQVLASVPEISEIIPVLREPDIEECMKLIEEHGMKRQDSVRNGLGNIEDEEAIVLVHDGVRPLIDTSLVGKVIAGLEGYDGCVCAVAPKDTIKEISEDGAIASTPSREKLLAVQTPQAFRYSTIMEAYNKAEAEGFRSTDDSALVERAGGKVNVVEGSYRNIKITTPEDMLVAELFLKSPP
jgi:2-C-methyl-D-erythritol 4-phosphate cytidylyltransferase